jgi:predicted ArsR family transcriptional regulator
MDKVSESLRWLGIDRRSTLPINEQVWEELVRLAKKTRKPVAAREIAQNLGRHKNRILAHLGSLRDRNRAANIQNGWIPLK